VALETKAYGVKEIAVMEICEDDDTDETNDDIGDDDGDNGDNGKPHRFCRVRYSPVGVRA
jgi:hypothetical protein